MHACVNTRVFPSSAAQTWYEGEKSDGHTMFSFVLNPKFRWSIEDGKSKKEKENFIYSRYIKKQITLAPKGR